MMKIDKKIRIGLMIALGIAILCSLLSIFNPTPDLQSSLTNKLFHESIVSDEIVIISLDKEIQSSENFNLKNRTHLANMLSNIVDANPKLISLQYIFTLPTEEMTSSDIKYIFRKIIAENLDKKAIGDLFLPYIKSPHPYDIALSKAISSSPKIIMGAYINNITELKNGILTENNIVTSIPVLNDQSTITSILDFGGAQENDIIRKYLTSFQTKDSEYDSFAVTAAKLLNSPFVEQIPTINKNKQMYINYFGKPYSYKIISAVDIYNNNFDKEELKNKIILIDATNKSSQTALPTPISPDQRMPKVEIHANALQTILDGKFLVDAPVLIKIIIVFSITILASTAFILLSIRSTILILLLFSATYYYLNTITFNKGIILDQIYPYVALFLSFISIYLYKYFSESKEKDFIANVFESYVNPDVLKAIQKDPSKLELGGEEKIITVLFSDIQNFTNISEKLSAANVVQLLNEYFTAMSYIVINNGGMIDKFEGDAIMANFGVPLPHENHAIMACKTAIEMQVKLVELRTQWASENKPELHCRIGINTGPVVAGNIGSKDRFDYTVMGDTVNLGSRLESANKFYQTNIMIGEVTYQQIKDYFITRHIDKIRVKGKDIPINVYEILSIKNENNTDPSVEIYNSGVELYFKKEFNKALQYFKKFQETNQEDKLNEIMIERCNNYIANPPEENWDGVFTLQNK